MKSNHKTFVAALLASFTFASPAQADTKADSTAWTILADLTTEIGQRLAGSPREAAAREWGAARMKALGLANVVIEPFTIKGYVRGTDKAHLIAPYDQPLAITALGYSGSTSEAGMSGDLVYFASLAALEAAPAGSLKGKIAYVDHAMKANQDGSGYGPYGNVRREGPAIAAKKGAAAIIIRSIGTDSHRNPHTGVTNWPAGVVPIPAGAVANPDADLIARVAAGGKPMRLSLTLSGHTQEGLPSGNVVGEIVGRDPSLPAILVACHLDSWDLGTGAIDNGAGCAIVTAAALKAGPALRTIRVLWAGSEEIGGFGGDDFAKRHANQPHALAMESDFGADRVWNVKLGLGAANEVLNGRITAALNPLGVVLNKGEPGGGSDIEAIAALQKLAVIDLSQDGTHYFDLHHTPDDTLDKVDPAMLQQNVDAWAVVLGVVANEPGVIVGK